MSLFERYPRYANDKILYSKEDLLEYIREKEGYSECLVSLYSYERIVDNRPDPDSAIVDKLLIILDTLSEVKSLHRVLIDRKIKHLISYTGDRYYLFILTKPIRYLDIGGSVALFAMKRLEPNLTFPVSIIYDPMEMIIVPNTYNPKTRRYCIPLTYEEIEYLKQEDIDRLSMRRRGRVYIPEIDNLRYLDLEEYM